MRIPDFKEPGLTKFLTDFSKEQDKKAGNYLTKRTANHSVLLMSPSKKIYEITVSDAGALVATLVLTP